MIQSTCVLGEDWCLVTSKHVNRQLTITCYTAPGEPNTFFWPPWAPIHRHTNKDGIREQTTIKHNLQLSTEHLDDHIDDWLPQEPPQENKNVKEIVQLQVYAECLFEDQYISGWAL